MCLSSSVVFRGEGQQQTCVLTVVSDIQRVPQTKIDANLEALQQIRDAHAISALPIIVLTSSTEPGLRERCVEAGASVFMNKPVGPARLAQTIKRQLSEVQEALERVPA